MTITRLAATASIDELCAALEQDGVAVIEGLVGEEMLQRLWEDLGPALEDNGFGDNDFTGYSTKRMSSLFARSRHMAALALDPLFLGAVRRLIEQPVPVWLGGQRVEISPNVQISATQVIQIWPSETPQMLHRDDTSHLLPYPAPTSRVQLMLAMSDFTAANGATLVIPGSHRWDNERGPQRGEALPAQMSPGSCLVWVGGLYHGGGANASNGPRTGLTLSMVRGNLRQEENQYLAVPREVVREYPEELRRLLGYDVCPPFLGWYESADPHALLDVGAREESLGETE